MKQLKGVKGRKAEISGERPNGRCGARAQGAEIFDRAWLLRSGKELFECARAARNFAVASEILELMARIAGRWNEGPGENPTGNTPNSRSRK